MSVYSEMLLKKKKKNHPFVYQFFVLKKSVRHENWHVITQMVGDIDFQIDVCFIFIKFIYFFFFFLNKQHFRSWTHVCRSERHRRILFFIHSAARPELRFAVCSKCGSDVTIAVGRRAAGKEEEGDLRAHSPLKCVRHHLSVNEKWFRLLLEPK